jgi:hypothetical protein
VSGNLPDPAKFWRTPGYGWSWPSVGPGVSEGVGAEEQVTERLAMPVGEPALAQVLGPVVQDVTALAERPEVLRIVVARVVVEVGAG